MKVILVIQHDIASSSRRRDSRKQVPLPPCFKKFSLEDDLMRDAVPDIVYRTIYMPMSFLYTNMTIESDKNMYLLTSWHDSITFLLDLYYTTRYATMAMP